VSKQTISTITEKVMEGLAEWQNRPLDAVYAVLFIDAINVKIRDGNVANRPIYLALGVTAGGERDILGLWAGEHGDGEGAKFWLRVLTEIKNRGTGDVCMLVCDGLKGLPDAVAGVWPQTVVQTCIVHLLRNSFKYASKKHWGQLAKDLKPVYTAASEAAALDAFAAFSGTWEKRYPAIVRLWENAWGGICAVPGLRHRDQNRDLHDQRHRIHQRAPEEGGQRPRPLPQRASSDEVPVPGADEPRPDRQGPQTLDQPVEGRPQRLRHHLRRPSQRGTEITTKKKLHR
jgi:hypothetical protein